MKKTIILFCLMCFFGPALFAQADSTNITDVTNVISQVANNLAAGTPAAVITKVITTVAGVLLVVLKPWNWFKRKNKNN